MSLKITDKSYWFVHNLTRLPFVILWLPFEFLIEFFYIIKTLFTFDGSETFCFPWEHREIEFKFFEKQKQ